ncbi:MAG: thioredoxin family protein [Flavobacteriales bacterium]|jgi:peroxiredoxin
MSLTPTNPMELGFKAPEFSLVDVVTGTYKTFQELKGERGTVVMFICNHCPFVVHVREELVRLANDYLPKGIKCIAISSNDAANYPQDGPELMKKLAERDDFPFSYLYDESQQTAKAYHAACTPDFSVFNENMECVYRGQLDDSRPGNGIAVSGKDIREVCELLWHRTEVPAQNQTPSIGCNIKWK